MARSPTSTRFSRLLTVEGATHQLQNLPRKEFVHRVQAIGYVMSKVDDTPADVVAMAGRIASGRVYLQDDRLLPKLTTAIEKAGAVDRYTKDFNKNVPLDFGGVVDLPANLALDVTSLAVRASSLPGHVRDFTRNLPVTSNLEDICRGAIRSLIGLRGRNSTSILNNDEFKRFSNIDLSLSADQLISILPQNAQRLAADVLSAGVVGPSRNTDSIETALRNGVNNVLIDARSRFTATAAEVANGRQALTSGLDTITVLSRDMEAVARISSFILSDVIGDERTAQQISTGIQVAHLVMSVGLMLSTGGVGVLAGAGTILSGLQSLEGLTGSGSSDGATQVLLKQISEQIQTLRAEMHARFDRVEALQLKALGLLGQLSSELAQTKVIVLNKLEKIEFNSVEHYNYSKRVDRRDMFNKFDQLCQKVRTAVASPSSYNESQKLDMLNGLLSYSIGDSGHEAFTSEGSANLVSTVKELGRADLAISLLSKVGETLGLVDAPHLVNNPIEWARGVQAYLEAHTKMREVENREVIDYAKRSWEIGRRTHDSLSKFCTEENLRSAILSFASRAVKMNAEITQAVRASTGDSSRPPFVGKLERAKHSNQFLALSPNHPPGTKFLTTSSPISENWEFIAVRPDPFEEALSDKSLILHEGQKIPISIPGIPIGRGIRAPIYMGECIEYTVYGRNSRSFGTIRKLKLTTQTYRFVAWDTSQSPNPNNEPALEQIRAFLDDIRDNVDDSSLVHSWAENLNSLSSRGAIKEYMEEAAGLALFTSFLTWHITGQVDDPWNSAVSSQMPRSIDDIKQVLHTIAIGASHHVLPLLKSNRALYNQISSKLGPRPQDPTQYRVVPWQEMNLRISFELLAQVVLTTWITNTNEAADALKRHIPPERSVGIVERTMEKFGAFLSSAGT